MPRPAAEAAAPPSPSIDRAALARRGPAKSYAATIHARVPPDDEAFLNGLGLGNVSLGVRVALSTLRVVLRARPDLAPILRGALGEERRAAEALDLVERAVTAALSAPTAYGDVLESQIERLLTPWRSRDARGSSHAQDLEWVKARLIAQGWTRRNASRRAPEILARLQRVAPPPPRATAAAPDAAPRLSSAGAIARLPGARPTFGKADTRPGPADDENLPAAPALLETARAPRPTVPCPKCRRPVVEEILAWHLDHVHGIRSVPA